MKSSFSADTKDALARDVPSAAHCRKALLTGLALYGSNPNRKAFVTQRNPVARLFWSLLANRKAHPIVKIAGTRLYRAASYAIDLPESLQGMPPNPRLKCDRVMEVRAALLACGSLPSAASGYHLEFVLPDPERASRLTQALKTAGEEPKRSVRKSRIILYYKDFEAIVALLSKIGAFSAVLHLEDVRAVKETKNRIHRLVNTEAANVERSTAAAAVQRRTIAFVADAHGLAKLPRSLREICELRLLHPEESLAELGRRCNPQAGKSAVHNRLAMLRRLAARLRGAPKRATSPVPVKAS
ncbi:MAG: DNA-binding protein WhiA [Candidatus Meridianibacter frigidus]|nr:MAG: DNA-binding protein WhiA [Candidatus Eremiobacteraeota bacterium]